MIVVEDCIGLKMVMQFQIGSRHDLGLEFVKVEKDGKQIS